MKPFVFLASRGEQLIAEDEYQAFLRMCNLRPDQLLRVRLEEQPMPDINLDQVSGFIVGGSPFSNSTPQDKKSDIQIRVEGDLRHLLDTLVPRDFPFFGACYGVGTLGGHQGAIIDDTYAEEISAPLIRVTEAGRAHPIMSELPDEFHSYVGHKESCAKLPDNAVLMATGDACPVQMFRIGDNMFGTQFHPEMDWAGLELRINEYQHAGYYPPDEKQRIVDACKDVDVSASHSLLRRFVELYAR